MTSDVSLAHVIERLQQARVRVASGWPSVALALAGAPPSTAQARLLEAEEARHAANPPPWALVLLEALAFVDEAREMWGATPDVMPPMASDLAPCGRDLRLFLTPARKVAEMGVAWEDPAGLSRSQALCVVHLAVCLAQWRMQEERAEVAAAKAQQEIDAGRHERAATAARAIWGAPVKTPREEPGPRSLRDLAHVSAAFDQWTPEDDDR